MVFTSLSLSLSRSLSHPFFSAGWVIQHISGAAVLLSWHILLLCEAIFSSTSPIYITKRSAGQAGICVCHCKWGLRGSSPVELIKTALQRQSLARMLDVLVALEGCGGLEKMKVGLSVFCSCRTWLATEFDKAPKIVTYTRQHYNEIVGS